MSERSVLVLGGAVALLTMLLAGCGAQRAVLDAGRAGAMPAGQGEAAVQRALEHLPDGQRLEWRDAADQASGAVSVERTFQDVAGRYCRSYTLMMVVAGATQTEQQTRCRAPGGSWVREPA